MSVELRRSAAHAPASLADSAVARLQVVTSFWRFWRFCNRGRHVGQIPVQLPRRYRPPEFAWAYLLLVNLLGLGLRLGGRRGVSDLRVTLFQPFRMATVFRGLALVAFSGRLLTLWQKGPGPNAARATLLTVGLAGDCSLVVATLVEVACATLERSPFRPAIRLAVAGVRVGRGSITSRVMIRSQGIGRSWPPSPC